MIKREIRIFLIVGGLTVLVDFICYRGLVFLDLLSVDIGKAVGFLTGTVFAYFANRFWTFGHHTHPISSVWRFAMLYAATLSVNVGANGWVLKELAGRSFSIHAAFLAATALSAALNFLGMKFFVFRTGVTTEKAL